jgi:thiamine pyrophosphate-dependent acetolactate synthase large subunit-like protein
VSTPVTKPGPQTGAGLLVKSLEAQGVEYVFGIPGAKIDKVFDTLLDSTIKTVVCRHDPNAAFIAGGIGRMTGKVGVALVTSGPGCSNLVTGLATANSEGDPVVAGIPVDYRDNHRLMEGPSQRAQSRHAAQETRSGDTNQAWMPHPVGWEIGPGG